MKQVKGMMKQRFMTAIYVSLGLVLLLKVSSNQIAITKLPIANCLQLALKFFLFQSLLFKLFTL